MMSANEYEFQDILDTEHLPVTFKITSGYFGCSSEEYDFATGEVYTAESVDCAKAVLQFINTETGRGEERRVTPNFILKFEIVCYDPERQIRVYRTVNELRYVCPFLVQCGRDYKDPLNPSNNFSKGHQLRLMRFVNKTGQIELECQSLKGSKFKYLPMNCRGDFKAVCNAQQYTIADMMRMFRRRCKLLITLADHPINLIHGHTLPVKKGADIVFYPPKYQVVLCKDDSPGSKETVPLDIPLTVSPRSGDYESPLLAYYGFEKFIGDNAYKLPFVVKIMDWQEANNTFECHGIRPGVRLHVFEMKEVSKVLAHSEDKFLSIPINNETQFSVNPNIIHGVDDLVKYAPCTVKVTESSSPRYSHYLKRHLTKGQIVRIPNTHRDIKMINGIEEETVHADIFDESLNEFATVDLPLFMDFTFEEVTSGAIFMTRHMQRYDKPVSVKLKSPDMAVNRINDVITHNESVVLCCCIEEDAVLVSTDSDPTVSFYLPTHSGLLVSLDRQTAVMETRPPLSPNDRCIQVLSEERFIDLSERNIVYQQLYAKMSPPISPKESTGSVKYRLPPPPLPVDADQMKRGEGTNCPPPIPPRKLEGRSPDSSDGLDMSESSVSLNIFAAAATPPLSCDLPKTAVVKPTVKQKNVNAVKQRPVQNLTMALKSALKRKAKPSSPGNYGNWQSLKQQQHSASLPEDGNLNNLSVDEMAKFLEAMSVSPRGVRAVYEHSVNGYRFGLLSDEDLAYLDMTDDAGVVKTFRDKTLRMRKSSTLPVQTKK